ncbi:MAG: hypothetical protein PF487_08160 [Bacteroidales bacterium]|jgi:hypothetical protein|nr:hypothetical protein [Bacteroidales bacterium]
MGKEIVIFCQAGADLMYTVDLISKNKNKHINVYVVHVKGVYDYLKSLSIPNITLTFLPYIPFSTYKFWSSFSVKNELNELFENIFLKYMNCDVYFFSTSYDWLTATIAARLSERNKVFYYNHYDDLTNKRAKKQFSLKRLIKSKFLQFITGVRFIHNITVNAPRFIFQDWNIKEVSSIIKPSISNEFLYDLCFEGETIMFFLSTEEFKSLTLESQKQLLAFISSLRNLGKIVVLKGHPRLGVPQEVEKACNFSLPSFVPSEFVNYNKVSMIYGLTSTALCYPAQKTNVKVISLLDALNFVDNVKAQSYKEYIATYSENKIVFAASLEIL